MLPCTATNGEVIEYCGLMMRRHLVLLATNAGSGGYPRSADRRDVAHVKALIPAALEVILCSLVHTDREAAYAGPYRIDHLNALSEQLDMWGV